MAAHNGGVLGHILPVLQGCYIWNKGRASQKIWVQKTKITYIVGHCNSKMSFRKVYRAYAS